VIDRTTRLKNLMEQHKVTTKEVGELLDRSTQTVRCWRCQWESRTIPHHTLAVLEMLLAERVTA